MMIKNHFFTGSGSCQFYRLIMDYLSDFSVVNFAKPYKFSFRALHKHIIRTLGLLTVFFIATGTRIWRLREVPTVVNGDEAASLYHSWQIILGKLSPFSLARGGNVYALVYYPNALMTFILGIQDSLLATRLATVFFSLLALFVFYLLLKKETSFLSAILATLLLSLSYWYLNFSRLGFIVVNNVFLGLLFYYILDKAINEKGLFYSSLTGVIAFLVVVNYMAGYIYLLVGGLWVLACLIRFRKGAGVKVLIMVVSFMVTVSPLIINILSHRTDFFFRAQAVSVFNLSSPYYNCSPQNIRCILIHQLKYVWRGFVSFDGEVSSEGIENQRYLPFRRAAVNILVKFLFYLGLLIGLVIRRKGFFFFIIYLLNIFLLQLPTVYIPSWSRAMGVLPAIYYFAGLSIEEILKLSRKITIRDKVVLPAILVILSLVIAGHDFRTYWQWVQSRLFLTAQEPAVKIYELPAWQRAQYRWIKEGKFPFNIYEWQNEEFRKQFLNIIKKGEKGEKPDEK